MDLCQEYLTHSYLYYECNESIILDAEFDRLCLEMLKTWDSLESNYKYLVEKEDLECGTGFNCTYPEEIKREALERLTDYEDLIL